MIETKYFGTFSDNSRINPCVTCRDSANCVECMYGCRSIQEKAYLLEDCIVRYITSSDKSYRPKTDVIRFLNAYPHVVYEACEVNRWEPPQETKDALREFKEKRIAKLLEQRDTKLLQIEKLKKELDEIKQALEGMQ